MEYPLEDVARDPNAFLSRPNSDPPAMDDIPENAVPTPTENVHFGLPGVRP